MSRIRSPEVTCKFGGPLPECPGLGNIEALREVRCPHPEAQEPPSSSGKSATCEACLRDLAKGEPVVKGVWGPLKTLSVILAR